MNVEVEHCDDVSERKPERVGVVLIVKNEASYLLEWVAHYRVLGFNDIFIYDNGSTDATPRVLAALERKEIIHHVSWPDKPHVNRQVSAYDDAISRFGHFLDWVAFFDSDEFLVLHLDADIQEFLRRYSGENGVAINWRVFGSGGRKARTRGLVVERFCHAAFGERSTNRCVKVIVRPRVVAKCNVHIAHLSAGTIVDTAGLDIMPSLQGFGIHSRVVYDIAQLNHYILKSREEWDIKRARGRGAVSPEQVDQNWGDERFMEHDFSDEIDTLALKYGSRTRSELNALYEILDASDLAMERRFLQELNGP